MTKNEFEKLEAGDYVKISEKSVPRKIARASRINQYNRDKKTIAVAFETKGGVGKTVYLVGDCKKFIKV